MTETLQLPADLDKRLRKYQNSLFLEGHYAKRLAKLSLTRIAGLISDVPDELFKPWAPRQPRQVRLNYGFAGYRIHDDRKGVVVFHKGELADYAIETYPSNDGKDGLLRIHGFNEDTQMMAMHRDFKGIDEIVRNRNATIMLGCAAGAIIVHSLSDTNRQLV